MHAQYHYCEESFPSRWAAFTHDTLSPGVHLPLRSDPSTQSNDSCWLRSSNFHLQLHLKAV